jgi:hypothetical protein
MLKIRIVESDHSIDYIVTDREGITEAVMADMLYIEVNGVYRKSYPKDALMFAHDWRQVEANYNVFINKELHPENKNAQDIQRALQWTAEQLNQHGIRWWLTGSGALYARGLPVVPHDFDIMTFKDEIEKIQPLVQPYIVEPFHHVTDWVVKGFGVVDYGIRLDFAFEPEDWVDGRGPADFGPYAQAHLETIDWQGYSIQVPPVELHIAPNQARGRHDRVQLIYNYLNQ